MIPFDPLTGGALLLLATAQGQQPKITDGCKIPKPAEISVVPRSEKITLDTSRSLAQLQKERIDTINPYGYDISTHTNGYMSGQVDLTSEVNLDYSYDKNTSGLCLWYDRISIGIEIDPTIVIASEVAADPCMKQAVYEHEMKHVMADRKIANKYAKTIGKVIYEGLAQRGFLVGPIGKGQGEQTAGRMKATVVQLMDLQSRKLEIELAEAQQAIDNVGEYQRVKAQCPDYRAPR